MSTAPPTNNERIVTTNPDPTQNVRELVVAANLRSDDLRMAEAKRVDEALDAARLRFDGLHTAIWSRVSDAMSGESRRVNEQMEGLRREATLRADFSAQLNLAETKRIDAIRAVDVAAVAIANERATAQATVLANQVATSAETLRALVATQAAASAQQFATSTAQMSDRISLLERSSYEGQGKSTVQDPMMAIRDAKMDALIAAMSKGEGRAGVSTPLMLAIAASAGGLILFIVETLSRAPIH